MKGEGNESLSRGDVLLGRVPSAGLSCACVAGLSPSCWADLSLAGGGGAGLSLGEGWLIYCQCTALVTTVLFIFTLLLSSMLLLLLQGLCWLLK